jgi:hypothetical protein
LFVADWDIEHTAFLTPDMRPGLALALRPLARAALADARAHGLTYEQTEACFLAILATGPQRRVALCQADCPTSSSGFLSTPPDITPELRR